MGEYHLQPTSRVVFHTLAFRRRMNDYLVGYEAGGKYLQVEEEGVDIIKALQTKTFGAVEKKFPHKDVEAFIALLAKKGLIWRIDHRVISQQAHIASLVDMSVGAAKKFVNPYTIVAYFAVILIGLYNLFTLNYLLPKPEWLLPTQWYAAMIPAMFLVWWIVVFMHEFVKYVVLRSSGHETSMSIIHKWHLLLPHTDVRSVRMLTKNKQIGVFIAGISSNMFLLSIASILLVQGISILIVQFIMAIVFINLLFELIHIPRTDLAEALSIQYETNSTAAVWGSMKKLCLFCPQDDARIAKEQKAGKELLPVTVFGAAIAIILVLVYVLPTLTTILSHSFNSFLQLPSTDITQLVDALLSILLLAIFLSFFIVSLLRTHELNVHSWFTWMWIFAYVVVTYIVVLFISLALLTLVGPLANILAHLFLGTVFGVLFVRLIDHVQVKKGSFVREYFLPVFAASTGLLLIIMGMWYSAATGVVHAEAIYAIAYTIGMLAALVI